MTTTGNRASSTPLLAYQKRPQWHRRRQYRRVILMLLVVAGAAALWHWHEPIRSRGRLLYWQHQCLNYTAAPNQIVGLADSYDVADAVAKTDPSFASERTLYDGFARRTSPTWDAYRLLIDGPITTGGMFAGTLPTPSTAVMPRVPGPTIAFMHGRATSAGTDLVVVFLSEEHSKMTAWELNAFVYRRSFFPERVDGNWAGGILLDGSYLKDGAGVRVQTAKFFAGQADARDPSRFSIRYEYDGGGGTIDGQLLPDETVKLIVRDGPASPPERWQNVGQNFDAFRVRF